METYTLLQAVNMLIRSKAKMFRCINCDDGVDHPYLVLIAGKPSWTNRENNSFGGHIDVDIDGRYGFKFAEVLVKSKLRAKV